MTSGNVTAGTTTNQSDGNKSVLGTMGASGSFSFSPVGTMGTGVQMPTTSDSVGSTMGPTIPPSTNDQVVPITSTINQSDGNKSDSYQTMADVMQTAISLFRNSGSSSESGSLALNSTTQSVHQPTWSVQSINPAAIVIPPMFGRGPQEASPNASGSLNTPSKNVSNEAVGESQSSNINTRSTSGEPSTDSILNIEMEDSLS